MNAIDRRVSRLLGDHARDVYTDQTRTPTTIPLDRRCPGCGVERDGCDHPMCSRYLSPGEE